ncbi:transcription factor Opi1-domain-containing protein [Phlyctochytrium arcticum]|nr:transcription factor Opi1-domain-containing protein [Phlyctochytrium arcticum]
MVASESDTGNGGDTDLDAGGDMSGPVTDKRKASTSGGGHDDDIKWHKPVPNPLHLPNDIFRSSANSGPLPLGSIPPQYSAYSSQTASSQSSPVSSPTTPMSMTGPVFSIGNTPIHSMANHFSPLVVDHHVAGSAPSSGVQQDHATCQPDQNPNHPSNSQRIASKDNTPRLSLSINNLCNNADSEPVDPDVRMAAEALGGLSRGYDNVANPQEHFMQRVTNIPLVNKSINQLSTAYEATKNASRVVKYSAESVETGVKTITKPVLNKLEPALAPLDRFACTQLDKLERSFPSIMGAPNSTGPHSPLGQLEVNEQHNAQRNVQVNGQVNGQINGQINGHTRERSLSASSTSSISSLDLLQPPNVPLICNNSGARSPQFTSSSEMGSVHIPGPPLTYALASTPYTGTVRGDEASLATAPRIDRKPRSRWHQVVAGVGANLSGLMLSDETMRGLKYCLQWLQYATNHIDRQIAALREFLARSGQNAVSYVSGLASGSTSSSQPTPPLSPQNAGEITAASSLDIFTLIASIKREVVETLRRVVDVIGRHAAVYLPGDARRNVRGFILGLPARWASIAGLNKGVTNEHAPNGDTEAHKVLTLATESASMLQGVQHIFTETVESAERMGRVVGGTTSPTASQDCLSDTNPSSETILNGTSSEESHEGLNRRTKRRRQVDEKGKGKVSSGDNDNDMDCSESDGTM